MMLFEAFLYDIIIFTCKYLNQYYTRLCAGPSCEVQHVHLEKAPLWIVFSWSAPDKWSKTLRFRCDSQSLLWLAYRNGQTEGAFQNQEARLTTNRTRQHLPCQAMLLARPITNIAQKLEIAVPCSPGQHKDSWLRDEGHQSSSPSLIRRNQGMAEHGGASPRHLSITTEGQAFAPVIWCPITLEIEKSHQSCCQRAAPYFSISSVRLDSSSCSLTLVTSPTNYNRPYSTSTATDIIYPLL